MILGSVNDDLEAVVSVRVRGRQIETSVNLIIDTGFSEFVTLSPETISALDLDYFQSAPVQYADGRFDRVHVYYGQVYWDGDWRRIFVQATDGDTLGGMRLLENHSVGIDVVVGGDVVIAAFD